MKQFLSRLKGSVDMSGAQEDPQTMTSLSLMPWELKKICGLSGLVPACVSNALYISFPLAIKRHLTPSAKNNY